MKIPKWVFTNYLNVKSIKEAMQRSDNAYKTLSILSTGNKLKYPLAECIYFCDLLQLDERYGFILHKIRSIVLLIHTLYFVDQTILPSNCQRHLLDEKRRDLIVIMDLYFNQIVALQSLEWQIFER